MAILRFFGGNTILHIDKISCIGPIPCTAHFAKIPFSAHCLYDTLFTPISKLLADHAFTRHKQRHQYLSEYLYEFWTTCRDVVQACFRYKRTLVYGRKEKVKLLFATTSSGLCKGKHFPLKAIFSSKKSSTLFR